MGNGAKAQMKRDRNSKATTEAKSQLKINEQAKNIICNVCKQSYMCVVRAKELEEHALNKHKKTLKDCFPEFVEVPKNNKKK